MIENRTVEWRQQMGLPAHKIPPPARFPKAEIESILKKWWKEQQDSASNYGDPFADSKSEGVGTVFDIQPKLSSQEAVTVLIKLEKVLGYEPTTSVIKRGGYKTCDEFVQDLTARVQEGYSKKNS
jgi:hypothetical protein